jgi:hypothetical protein
LHDTAFSRSAHLRDDPLLVLVRDQPPLFAVSHDVVAEWALSAGAKLSTSKAPAALGSDPKRKRVPSSNHSQNLVDKT